MERNISLKDAREIVGRYIKRKSEYSHFPIETKQFCSKVFFVNTRKANLAFVVVCFLVIFF